jgi:hypothetical protein
MNLAAKALEAIFSRTAWPSGLSIWKGYLYGTTIHGGRLSLCNDGGYPSPNGCGMLFRVSK